MKSNIQKLCDELTTECSRLNKKCIITIINTDKSSHYKVIDFVVNRVCELFSVDIQNIKNWKKTVDERKAKKMIVFTLINRLSIPIKDVSAHLGVSSQSISYISLNPYGVYKIDNYENIVYKIEDELKERLYLSP